MEAFQGTVAGDYLTYLKVPQQFARIFKLLFRLGKNDMYRKLAMTIIALSLGGCFILTSSPASAQSEQQHGKAQGQSQGGSRAAAPRSGGGNANAPRGGGRNAFTPRGGAQTFTPRANRTVTQRATRTTVTPRATRKVTQRATRTTVTPRTTITPRATRTVTPGVVTPKGAAKIVTPSGSNAHVVTAGKFRSMPLRGAGRTIIRGQNFSVWRSRYRVRHGNRWSTFVALSALSAIIIGSSDYYPYAYISAPQPYCEGLTEDGCQLMWQEVQTVEGDVVDQCVAYCPWQ